MTPRVQRLYDCIVIEKSHRAYRKDWDTDLASEFAAAGLTPIQRVTERFVRLLEREEPVLLPHERIVFQRTVRGLPPLFTAEEWRDIQSSHYIHEAGAVCNISPGYAEVIAKGLEPYRNFAAEKSRQIGAAPDKAVFYQAVVRSIEAVYGLCERYRQKALEAGNHMAADILSRLPQNGAKTFHEALQLFRILHFALWCEGEYHNTVGRFDQYMYGFLQADLDAGRLTQVEAYELLLEFFLSFNRDSDLYPGVQQGDNGQSMVLGGVDNQGEPCFNTLSHMCLEASRELKLIDPKINLRVSSRTPHEIFVLGTELTKEGLGFPQYSNDDIVIPGLVEKGYSLEDARNYVVAACWEFIIPKFGMDIPNIGALSFPKAVDRCLHRDLAQCTDFESFLQAVFHEIQVQCTQITVSFANIWMLSAPFMSIHMDGCLETGRDISQGCRYNNYGIHGTGLSTAADSLAAIERYVYREKTLTPEALIAAIERDFEGCGELLARLREEAPKMGNDDDAVDGIAAGLLDAFAEALEGCQNERGGVYRAGTGSAMYYLWHANEIGASPDGRRKGEAFGANYAPSLFARIVGPFSLIRSFTKPNLRRVINGGPLTMEFSDTMFRDAETVDKVAALVEYFIHAGGHQLQLNAVNRERLLQAQQNPQAHSRLIVRVWGWSAYFIELDREYQDHVIRRTEYTV